jgi:hypothetical protein
VNLRVRISDELLLDAGTTEELGGSELVVDRAPRAGFAMRE